MSNWTDKPTETGHYFVSLFWPPAALPAWYLVYDNNIRYDEKLVSLDYFLRHNPEAQFSRIEPVKNVYAEHADKIKQFCRDAGVMEPKSLPSEAQARLTEELNYQTDHPSYIREMVGNSLNNEQIKKLEKDFGFE